MTAAHKPTHLTRIACAVAVALALVTTACSSGDESSPDRTSGSTAAPVEAEFEVPDTLADKAFPSVTHPQRDGSLKAVAAEMTTVARADAPMTMVARPGHDGQLFLAERAGRVRLVTIDKSDRSLRVHSGSLLDLSDRIATDGEMGLLGLAFSRDGDTLYLSYNLKSGDSRIDAAAITDPASGPKLGKPTKLLEVDQPAANNHKGGDLVVDPDGHLLIGLGDGGFGGDPDDRARNPNQLLGKILRIDPTRPTAGKPYGIPPSNPYASGDGGAPEVWLTGLRNPWRFSLDPANGDVWIGDVGQDEIEEIDRLPGDAVSEGANLGWSGYEGTTVFDADRINGPTVPPVFEMAHSSGVCSVTGGVVYRGDKLPALDGAYLFSDLCRPGVRALRATTPADGIGTVTDERGLRGAGKVDQIISFATDADGEVYTLSIDDTIRRLDPAS